MHRHCSGSRQSDSPMPTTEESGPSATCRAARLRDPWRPLSVILALLLVAGRVCCQGPASFPDTLRSRACLAAPSLADDPGLDDFINAVVAAVPNTARPDITDHHIALMARTVADILRDPCHSEIDRQYRLLYLNWATANFLQHLPTAADSELVASQLAEMVEFVGESIKREGAARGIQEADAAHLCSKASDMLAPLVSAAPSYTLGAPLVPFSPDGFSAAKARFTTALGQEGDLAANAPQAVATFVNDFLSRTAAQDRVPWPQELQDAHTQYVEAEKVRRREMRAAYERKRDARFPLFVLRRTVDRLEQVNAIASCIIAASMILDAQGDDGSR